MSIDQALGALIAAIQANTAAILGQASAPQAAPQQAPPQVQQQPPANTWAPQQPPAGMPPGPNFGPPPQAAPQQAPFNSQQDLYDYCTHVYQSNNAMGPKMEVILKQMTPGGEASQIQPNQYGQFFAAVEAARASA